MQFSKVFFASLALTLSALASAGVSAETAALTVGQVKKIDLKAQTITLQHGTIKNLDMPPMTMVFKARTPALLAKVKPGDKVKFGADMPDGVLTVTTLELAK